MDQSPAKRVLTKEQKIGFVLLLVFAFFAVGIGVLQVRNTMYRPFALKREVPLEITDSINSQEVLYYRDTDHDGLNDYEELTVYHTSPYLADTDSDGVDDHAEVQRHTNPLCNEATSVCADSSELAGSNLVNTSTTLTGTSVSKPDPSPYDLSTMLTDPAQVRRLLIEAGASKQELDQVSDNDLMTIVRERLAAQQATLGNATASTATSTSSAQDIASVANDPIKLRQALRNAGIDEKILSQIPDKDLLETARQLLGNNQLNTTSSYARP